MIEIRCPSCHSPMGIENNEPDTEWECPWCGSAFLVDRSSGSSAPAGNGHKASAPSEHWSLGKAFMIGVASFIAFVVPFLAFFFVALTLGGIPFNPSGTGGRPHTIAIWVYPCGVIAGLPGLLVAVWLFRKFFAKQP